MDEELPCILPHVLIPSIVYLNPLEKKAYTKEVYYAESKQP